MCKMIISSDIFFHFFKILFFWVVRGVKGQKIVQNDEKFCVTLHISGTTHHMIIFVVHKCKMIISPGVFFFYFFKILIFWVVRRVKGQKMAQNNKKALPVMPLYLGNHLLYDLHLWYKCVKG